VSKFAIRKPNIYDSEQRLVILYLKGGSTDVPWSGLERLINAVESNVEYIQKIKILIAGKPETKFEKFSFIEQIGYVKEPYLTEMFNNCHIAINHLALYKIGLNESSNLKVREYFSRGIPFINASLDFDIVDSEFVFQVPNNEENIDIPSLLKFVDKVLKDDTHPQKMRKYAEENLDFTIKMKQLIFNLNSLIK
jgi:hypothetical protein